MNAQEDGPEAEAESAAPHVSSLAGVLRTHGDPEPARRGARAFAGTLNPSASAAPVCRWGDLTSRP